MKTLEELQQEHKAQVKLLEEVGPSLPYKQWMELQLKIHRLQKEIAKRKEENNASG